MTILIKDMEMPENCDRCKLVRYFGMAGGIECLAKKEWPATSYANEDFRESGTRPDWCPLVEVPDAQPDRNAQERYEDLCEYFKDCSDKGMGILGDRKEFKAWLERLHWHVVRCDELGREVEKLQSAQTERSSEIQDILEYLDKVLHPVISPDHWNVYSELHDMISKLPSAQPEQYWETCFDCPLSHGCPKIKGCTNEQAIEYASQIPNDCPLSAQLDEDMIHLQKEQAYMQGWEDSRKSIENLPSAQPERQRGVWIEYIPEHGKCPFCGNQVDLLGGKANNFCGECGADMRGE